MDHRGDQPLGSRRRVGTGQPKQEKWMASMRDRLTAPILVGIGAAFDFHAGLVPQAPSWMQNIGMEWAYRLLHEPRRYGSSRVTCRRALFCVSRT